MIAEAPTNSRAEVPLHGIRLRDAGNGQRVRMIKIRMDGPCGLRWIPFAKWWWENNRGPVPAGKRICHADGQMLNDSPDNLLALTPGEVFNLYHKLDPEMSRRNRAACGRAGARINVERGIANRGRFLPAQWYGVDFENRIIHNRPSRERWMILHDHGAFHRVADHVRRLIGDPSSTEDVSDAFKRLERLHWRWMISLAIGWPTLSVTASCILHVLQSGPLPRPQLFTALNNFRFCIGLRPIGCLGSMSSAACGISDVFLSQQRKLWSISAKAIAERMPGPHVIPVRGRHLDGSTYRLRDYSYQSTKRRDIVNVLKPDTEVQQ
jgi:hypothetical protein